MTLIVAGLFASVAAADTILVDFGIETHKSGHTYEGTSGGTDDVVFTAAAGALAPVTFTAKVVQDPAGITAMPAINEGGIVGAGLSQPPVQAVSSGGIASIFGSAFAVAGSFRQVGPDDIVNDRLPTNLGGVCVVFGNKRAFILHVLANQLNVQAPTLQAHPATA